MSGTVRPYSGLRPRPRSEAVSGPTYVIKPGTFFLSIAAVLITAMICLTYLAAHSPESIQALSDWLQSRGGRMPSRLEK